MIANRALNLSDLPAEFLAAKSGAPGSDLVLEALVKGYLPLVYGTALRLLPDSPDAALEVTIAVFQSFLLRARRLRRKILIATWLLRSTWFAARRKRKLLGRTEQPPMPVLAGSVPPSAIGDHPPGSYELLLKELFRLKPVCQKALLLRFVMNEPAEVAAPSLRLLPKRFERRAQKAAAKFSKKLKKAVPDAMLLLGGLQMPVPSEVETLVLASLRDAPPSKSPLVRSTLRAWRWTGIRLAFRRFASALGTIFCFLALLIGSFAWLAQHGYLTPQFVTLRARQMVKEMPELGQKARPWPVSQQDQALAQRTLPKSAAELYVQTNIWPAKLALTSEEWRKIAPTRVPPVPGMFTGDGKMILRNPKARRSGLAGVIGLDFNWVEGRMDFAGTSFNRVGIRYRGNGTYVNSLYGSKQSFKVDLNQFAKKQKLAGLEKLNFVNSIPDGSYIHDALAERLFRELGTPAPRTSYAYLTLDVPGNFNNQALGLYVLIEDIDKDYAADRFGSKNVPIFKPVTMELFSNLGDDWESYAATYDLKTKATPEQKRRIVELAKLVSQADDTEFARRLAEYLDLEEFAAFVAGHVLLSSYDGFLANGQNFYVYLDPKSNKLGFIPWDQDHSWGEFGYVGTPERREQASIWHPASYDFRFLERVMKVEAFRGVYRRTLENALANLFTKERLFTQVDRLAATIRPAVAAESDFRLKRFDQAVSGEWVPGPRQNQNPEGPKSPVHQIKRFIENRIVSVREQLDGKSKGARLKGRW